MAKYKSTSAGEHTIVRIGAELHKDNYSEAWKLSKQLCNQASTDENWSVARNVAKLACEHYLELQRPGDFAKFYDLAKGLPKGADNDWMTTLGILQAKAGYFTKAKVLLEPLNDPALLTQAIAHVADKSIVSHQAGLLPPEYLPAYDAIVTAFQHYQSGNDEAARESLNAVGLQSPYLEWKVLLRGLIAFTANDSTRAIENFARLKADRVPFKLATIFRAKIDAPFRDRLPPGVAANAEKKYSVFTTSILHQNLKSIQAGLGRGKSLAPVFSAADSAIPFLKAQKPELMPRLANCFYHAILTQGQPDDMKRYRKSFGSPKEDPLFHKLQGYIYEQTDQLDGAFECWQNYALWLDTPPAGWPADLAKRVQARVLFKLGNLASDLADWNTDEDEDDEDYSDFFSPKRKPKPKSKSKSPVVLPDPKIFFAGAMEVAPDWEEPALELFGCKIEAEDWTGAEKTAKAYLQHNTGSLKMLEGLADLYGKLGRAVESLACRKKVLAVNPLDQTVIGSVLKATLAQARKHAADKDFDTAESALGTVAELNGGNPHYKELVLRADMARKAGAQDQLEKLFASLGAQPQAMLTRYFLGQVHAVVLKFKPAMKKIAVAEFTEALKAPQPPIAWVALFMEMRDIDAEGWNFTGQIALSKKILAAIASSAQPGCENDSEGLAVILAEANEWPTLQKLAANLGKCYPRNPLFLLLEVEAVLAQGKKTSSYKLSGKLSKAQGLIRLTPQSRHTDLLPRIEKILDELNPMRSMFDSFFRPR